MLRGRRCSKAGHLALKNRYFSVQKPKARISIVDFEGLSPTSSIEDWKRVGDELSKGLHEIGFAYVKNTKLTEAIIQRTLSQSKWLFDQNDNLKNSIHATPENKYGYYEYLGNPSNPHLTEAFLACHPQQNQWELKQDYFSIASASTELQDIFKPHHNRWPDNQDFKDALFEYYFTCSQVSQDILEALAYSLDVEPQYFTRNHSKLDSTLEIKKYHPAQPPTQEFIQIGGGSIALPSKATKQEIAVNPHVDLTSVTLLAQNEINGLQVYTDNTWIDAPKLPNCILINTGDVLHRWTNNYFSSTIHQVIQNFKDDRFSLVYFCAPNWETKIFCDIPKLQDLPKKYPPIYFGDFVPF